MFFFGEATASFSYSSLFPLLLILFGLVLFVRNRKSILLLFTAFILNYVLKGYHEKMAKIKDENFTGLSNFKSPNREQRNKGVVRVLEIGVGPGSNFKYYPQNSCVTVVDPNPYFRKTFEENKSKFPNIKLEKFILGGGENMTEVESESVDVVITTAVLCSVQDVKAVLKEVKRVLVPGGQYMFLEHSRADKGTISNLLQQIISPVWPYILCGCHITRNLEEAIEETGFSKVNIRKFIAPISFILKQFCNPHIIGNVRK